MRLKVTGSDPAPGRGPAGLAWDGDTLWHADYREGALYGLDPASLAVRRRLRCPGNLSGLAWDGRSLWQSLFDEAMLRRVNPETNDFDQTIALPDYGWISGVTWDGAVLWAVAQQRGLLLAVDRDSGQVQRTLHAPVACGDLDYRDGSLWVSAATPMQFDEATQQFEWQAAAPGYAVVQIDAASGQEVARYAADAFYSGLCWAGETLWLANAGARTLSRAALA